MEIYEDWLSSEMTRAELNELSEEEKKERKRLQKKICNKKYRETNPEQKKKSNRKYRENNPEYQQEYYENNKEHLLESNRTYREEHEEEEKEQKKKYRETLNGKKRHTIGTWKHRGLQESDDDLDRIYELWQTQELCNACDCVLTRDGTKCVTDPNMDHDHITHRFRHIICRSCNTHDKWKQYFC